MSQDKILPFEEWAQVHLEHFKMFDFPADQLAQTLYTKLANEQQDIGQYFAIDTSGDPTLLYTPQDQTAKLEPFSNVFFTDHCWLPEPKNIHADWKQMGELRERLEPFTTYADSPSPELSIEERINQCDGKNLELDDYGLTEVTSLHLEKFPELESLSLWGDDLSDLSELCATLERLPKLRALWVNGCPLSTPENIQTISQKFPQIEILNSKFTENYTQWAISFISKSQFPETLVTLDLSDRDLTSLKPEAFAPFRNLQHVDFTDNPQLDLSNVNVIIPNIRSVNIDKGVQIPSSIIFINSLDRETGDISMSIPDRIWDHIQPVGDRWALGDEVALSIHPSGKPNFGAMPAASPKTGLTYFCFWPIDTINPMDEVTANFYPMIMFGDLEKAVQPKELTPMKPLQSKFTSMVTKKFKLKVFTDVDIFAENLHSERFEVTKNRAEADLVWLTSQQADFNDFYERKVYFNQIEGEQFLTVKDLIFLTVKEYMGFVPWMPLTFDLTDPEDVALFQFTDEQLRKTGQSNAWVIKAFDTSRAALMLVTTSVAEALRHASIGPRLAQRYMWNPLLVWGKKFDLRFIVLLKSVKPFELFAYKVFWPRLSPKPWCLEDFSDYERHFTVMNYVAPEKVTSKTWVDFVAQFEIENPHVKWTEMLQRIYDSMRDLFLCGCQKMVVSPYTKAMYGIDLMITNDYQPVILECNFQPDCHRACNLCPTFVDDVFETLYIQQPVTCDKVVQLK